MKFLLLTAVLVVVSSMTLMSVSPKSQDILRLLFADEPEPKYKEQLMLFGQFVGDWEFDGRASNAKGTHTTDKGEIHFAWVLQGRAIQDLWIEREVSDNGAKVYGTTMRFYDPKTDAWRVIWVEPGFGVVTSLIGRRVGEEIVLEGRDTGGKLIHWVFSQIRPDSFHWRAERQIDDKWQVYEELAARRKK